METSDRLEFDDVPGRCYYEFDAGNPDLLEGSVKAGVHTSIAGGLASAAQLANGFGCDAFQIFSGNPRGWRMLDLAPLDCERFREACARHQQSPVAIHANYLINLASTDSRVRDLSVAGYRREIERALALGADYLIVHPGCAMAAATKAAIATCAESIRQAAGGLSLDGSNGHTGLTLLLENTAGQGTSIGRSFEELAEILDSAGRDVPMGVCVDTAHLFAAGYAIHTEEGLAGTIGQLDTAIGLTKVGVIHANDSKTGFGSLVDRHEHVGKGKIGREAFARIVCHPRLREIPFICETPVDRPGDEKRNVSMLRRLYKRGDGTRPF